MAAPQTQAEINGGWSTLAHETAFLQTVAAETSATLTVAGYSDEGRPIHRLDLGNPTGSTWVIMTLVHFNEQAAREACLAFVRDLAYSTDPDVASYLADHRVVLVTPMNPDGVANGTRNTAQGDINKDHLRFATAPARVVQNLLHDLDPDLVVDAHEQHGSTPIDMMHYGIGTLAVHQGLRNITTSAITAVVDALEADGRVVTEYPIPGRVSGRENAALHHAASVLLETQYIAPMAHRVSIYETSLNALRQWHKANATALSQAKATSKAAGLANTPTPYILQTGDTAQGGAWPQTTLPVNLVGYQVTGPMPTDLMDAYGVTASGSYVPMTQAARVVVPLLFDPESGDKATTATRVLSDTPMPPEVEPVPMPPGGLADRWVLHGGTLRRIDHITGLAE